VHIFQDGFFFVAWDSSFIRKIFLTLFTGCSFICGRVLCWAVSVVRLHHLE